MPSCLISPRIPSPLRRRLNVSSPPTLSLQPVSDPPPPLQFVELKPPSPATVPHTFHSVDVEALHALRGAIALSIVSDTEPQRSRALTDDLLVTLLSTSAAEHQFTFRPLLNSIQLHPNAHPSLNPLFNPDSSSADVYFDMPILAFEDTIYVEMETSTQNPGRLSVHMDKPDFIFTSNIALSIPFTYRFFSTALDRDVLIRMYFRNIKLTYQEVTDFLRAIGNPALPNAQVARTCPLRYFTGTYPMVPASFLRTCSFFMLNSDGILCDQGSGLPVSMDKPWLRYSKLVGRWQLDKDKDLLFNSFASEFNDLVQSELGLHFTDGLHYAEFFVGRKPLPFTQDFRLLTSDGFERPIFQD
ncbi:hypothetical protein AAF712_013065 [Marasmius tenuissimus]|uniref:Uncharacterized protein n=1 Tax=Marasmius tenuissimus TaxID=585030 RepID=A0ABR2ZG19_9AGAR